MGRRLILDLDLIRTRFDLLSLRIKDVTIIIPDILSDHILVSQFAIDILEKLKTVNKTKFLELLPKNVQYPEQLFVVSLSHSDAELLQAISEDRHTYNHDWVVFATNNDVKRKVAEQSGIAVSSGKEIDGLINRFIEENRIHSESLMHDTWNSQLTDTSTVPNPLGAQDKPGTASTPINSGQFILQNILASTLTTVLLLSIWANKHFITELFPIWGLTLSIFVMGVLLFGFRARYRVSYGIVEVIFGVLATTRFANPMSYDSTFFFQAAAGIYIVVRGFDNIDKGIQERRPSPSWWNTYLRWGGK